MIRFTTGDILAEDVQALVNTVNCVGVMGRGIALQFKKAFPENFRAYSRACERGEVQPGRVFAFETGELTNPRYILNFPTKRHWRAKSRIEDIKAGLASLAELIQARGIDSIAVPPLGSGLGGLDWLTVRPLIEQALSAVEEVDIVVFEPLGAPEAKSMVRSRNAPQMTPGRAALVELMNRYLNGLLDPFVTLLEVHKLMYFMQEAGEPLRLEFAKGPYGPYAENLRHVLNEVEGHFLFGYADGGDAPDKPLELLPGAVDAAVAVLDKCPDSRSRLERVATLVGGFESSFGLELLSTVHWVLENHAPASREDCRTQVYGWNERKKRFAPAQVDLAVDVLTAKGWCSVAGWGD